MTATTKPSAITEYASVFQNDNEVLLPVATCDFVQEAVPVKMTREAKGENEVDESSDEERDRQKNAAGITCGIIGCFVGGPILALIAGFGAAHLTKNDGAVGDIARAVGDVGIYAKSKASEVNDKHHIVPKGKDQI